MLTPRIFTGKERDAESGNDYFGARYYASAVGRWLSPDWSAKVEPVPYAKLDDPQSLNLYSYVRDNPLLLVDADGHQTGPDRFGCSEGQKDCNTDQQKDEKKKPAPKTQEQKIDLTNSVIVLVRTDPVFYEEHVSLYVNHDGDWEIYDPDGGYSLAKKAGSGDIVTEDNHASESEWESRFKSQPGTTDVFSIKATSSDTQKIMDNIVTSSSAHENERPLPCANAISGVISGVGPFKNVKQTNSPQRLDSMMRNVVLPQ